MSLNRLCRQQQNIHLLLNFSEVTKLRGNEKLTSAWSSFSHICICEASRVLVFISTWILCSSFLLFHFPLLCLILKIYCRLWGSHEIFLIYLFILSCCVSCYILCTTTNTMNSFLFCCTAVFQKAQCSHNVLEVKLEADWLGLLLLIPP